MTSREFASQKIDAYSSRATRLQRLKKTIEDNLIWYAFVSPAILLIVVFMVVPIFQSLKLALYRWNGVRPRVYIGLDNFERLLDDRFFRGALQHTFIFSICGTVGTVFLGLLLAVAISRRLPGTSIYRVLFYLPVMVPITV
ncbi:MAG TPA: sugar ABC transporter permease, partial [Aggregatilineales bacterium]|nr:sugar ABC transporter permease [Aggregatilineales bacterium]